MHPNPIFSCGQRRGRPLLRLPPGMTRPASLSGCAARSSRPPPRSKPASPSPVNKLCTRVRPLTTTCPVLDSSGNTFDKEPRSAAFRLSCLLRRAQPWFHPRELPFPVAVRRTPPYFLPLFPAESLASSISSWSQRHHSYIMEQLGAYSLWSPAKISLKVKRGMVRLYFHKVVPPLRYLIRRRPRPPTLRWVPCELGSPQHGHLREAHGAPHQLGDLQIALRSLLSQLPAFPPPPRAHPQVPSQVPAGRR